MTDERWPGSFSLPPGVTWIGVAAVGERAVPLAGKPEGEIVPECKEAADETRMNPDAAARNLMGHLEAVTGQSLSRTGLLAHLVAFMANTAAKVEALEARVKELEAASGPS